MYGVDDRDTVHPLADVPQSDTGAPCPALVSDEHRVLLAYLISEPDPNWDGSYARSVGPETVGAAAIVDFIWPRAHFLGPPNDEAFSGHPLADRGLEPYGAFEIKQSSWIRRLERMNSVHPSHRPEIFDTLRHFIFSFHDSTFECVADGLGVKRIRGSIQSALQQMTQSLMGESHE